MCGSYLSSVEVGWRRLMSAALKALLCFLLLEEEEEEGGWGSTLSLGLFYHHPHHHHHHHHHHHLVPLQIEAHAMGPGAVVLPIRSSNYRESSSCSHPTPQRLQLGVSRITDIKIK